MGLLIRDDRQMKAFTGLSQAQCDRLLPVCSDIYQATQQHTYATGVATGTRRRTPGGGSTGQWPTMAEQWPFVLDDYKTYPPLDGRALQCGMARAKAHENRPQLSPILYDTLGHLELMPYRALATPEDWKAAWHGVDRLRLDAAERASHRAADDAKQREHDSGKKPHTLQHTVMALPNKLIVFLGRTFRGHTHDDIMLQQEFPPALDGCAEINVRVDWGYLGMQSDSRGDRMDIPTKKPRKSQKNPTPPWSEEQKAAHTALSQVRIFIAHAIGGMKRYNIVVHAFRNRKADFEDDAVGICAGLWNFALSY